MGYIIVPNLIAKRKETDTLAKKIAKCNALLSKYNQTVKEKNTTIEKIKLDGDHVP